MSQPLTGKAHKTKRWIVCGGYDDGTIRFYYTDRPVSITALEIECDPGKHFHMDAIADAESGRKPLILSPNDISHRDIAAILAAI